MKLLSVRTHTVIGLIVGLLLLIAPYIFMFSDIPAAALSAQLVGVFIIVSELITTSPYSLVKLVPMTIHIALDIVTGLFLATTPWLFHFADQGAHAAAPHLIVGLMVVAYALLTNPRADRMGDV